MRDHPSRECGDLHACTDAVTANAHLHTIGQRRHQSAATARIAATAAVRIVRDALAFLRRSVDGMKDALDSQDVNFAIVDLAVGDEVLLKARLVRHDWKLICSKADKWSTHQLENALDAGTAHTISPAKAEEFLTTEAGVDFKAHGYEDRVDQVSKLRNRAVHFTRSRGTAPISVKVAHGRGLDFVLWFVGSEFRD